MYLHLFNLIRFTSSPEEANPSLPLAWRVGASDGVTAAPARIHPTPSVNFVSNKTPQSTPICFIARKALSNPPLQPLHILYDATLNDLLPSAREGGFNAIVAIRFSLKKPKTA